MNLVKDYLDVVSSTVCDICGVDGGKIQLVNGCLLYTSPSPRD